MSLLANLVVGFIGLLHVYFLVLEMFLWDKPAGLRAFGRLSLGPGGTAVKVFFPIPAAIGLALVLLGPG